MININSIEEVRVEDFDEAWAIVRKLKSNPDNFRQVEDLSPSLELLNRYLELKENGEWNEETFNKVYVPAFLKELRDNPKAWELLNDLYRRDLNGEKICLACFCIDEQICHRSIIAGILQGMGADVIAKSDYSQYYDMYNKL